MQKPSVHVAKPVAVTPERDIEPAVDETTVPEATEPAEELNPVVTAGRSQALTKDAAVTAAVAFVAAAPSTAEVTSTAAAPPLSGLLSAIGTIVFNLYGFATRLVGGSQVDSMRGGTR